MANMKHYSDINGETVELVGNMFGMPKAKFAETFPGIRGRAFDSGKLLRSGTLPPWSRVGRATAGNARWRTEP